MCIRENVVLSAYVIINSDDTKNLTNFFDDHHHDFSLPLTGEEEEVEVYNYDEINVDVTDIEDV